MHANNYHKNLNLKTMMVWLSLILLASFAFSVHSLKDPVSMVVVPEVPKQGEPLVLSFAFNNPGLTEETYAYELYINGKLAMEGKSAVSALGSKQSMYTYKNPLQLGEQTTFLLKVITSTQTIEKTLSIPVYAPQVWTSFVSFASFSTTAMSSMTSMAYYNAAFTPASINVGFIFSIILILMLVFSVLAEPHAKRQGIFGRLNRRFNKLSTILFIIFMGVVLTQIVIIIGRIG